ncbi:MAG: extracellular solute-binding protein [Actinomycetota bacterium]|nr:MAG: family 1 extracellular solute-binding [Actinomycetota bacterium]MDO8949532.1 extracellular solute-binding protein [Actinomycetota bacterium]MDP3630312.1 extracellular solute-binding protein [Actinomycetota bacterium]
MRDRSVRPAAWRLAATALAIVLAFSLIGCAKAAEEPKAPEPVAVEKTKVVLASTTSTQDSGLFDVLIPAFEKANPEYTVEVIAVGSGEALKMGENKDADVLLVHSPAAEKTFMEAGFGIERRDVMYNDYVLVGPAADPAGVKAAKDLKGVMKALSGGKAPFMTRDDKSGTHSKELKLWKDASISPTGTANAKDWYLATGQGMGETLKIANEKQGYTISDRATFLTSKGALDLVILREGDKGLLNQYGVITVKDAARPEGAAAFMEWITSAEGQKVVGEYGVEKFGQALFTPNAK